MDDTGDRITHYDVPVAPDTPPPGVPYMTGGGEDRVVASFEWDPVKGDWVSTMDTSAPCIFDKNR